MKKIKEIYNKYKKIIFVFLSILVITPIFYFGYSYFSKIDYNIKDRAQEYYIKAIKSDPKNLEAYYKLSKDYIKNYQYQDAVDILKQALNNGLKRYKIYSQLGVAYFYLKKYYLSEKYFSKALKRDDGNYLLYYYFAKDNESMLRFEKAIYCYKKSIRLNRHFIKSYLGLARLYESLDEYYKAKYYAKRAKKIDFYNVDAHILLANIYLDLYEYKSAKRELNIAKRVNPKNAEIYFTYGKLYYLTKHYDYAVTQLKKAIKLNPNYTEVYNLLGDIYELKSSLNKDVRAGL